MESRKVIVNGKKRIIIVNHASGVDKTKEAVLIVLGKDRWEYVDDDKHKERRQA